MREMRPDLAQWASTAKTNALLADIYDLLAIFNANFCAKDSGRRPKRPKPYPRPDRKSRDQKHIGTPLPIEELRRRIFGTNQGGEN